jgi:GTP-binding protein Era
MRWSARRWRSFGQGADHPRALMGIALEGPPQIILADTPGLFEPKRRLDRAMVNAAWEGARRPMRSCWWSMRARRSANISNRSSPPRRAQERKFLVLNKVDATPRNRCWSWPRN